MRGKAVYVKRSSFTSQDKVRTGCGNFNANHVQKTKQNEEAQQLRKEERERRGWVSEGDKKQSRTYEKCCQRHKLTKLNESAVKRGEWLKMHR